MALDIHWDTADPQDFHEGRDGVVVDTLVLHTTEGGSIQGATEWWDRDDVVASAHYVIDGHRIFQRVSEDNTAFHAGSRVMNRRSVGIEIVGHCDRPEMWTPAVLSQLVGLSADIVLRHEIPVLRQPGPGICGHCDVPNPRNPNLRGGASGHHDPGRFFPWEEFFAALRTKLDGMRGVA